MMEEIDRFQVPTEAEMQALVSEASLSQIITDHIFGSSCDVADMYADCNSVVVVVGKRNRIVIRLYSDRRI